MPEEELPATKDEIKEAIKLEFIIRIKTADNAMIERLQYAYAELANFVPEELFLRYEPFGKVLLKGAVLRQHDLLDEHAMTALVQEMDGLFNNNHFVYPSYEIEVRQKEGNLLIAEISNYIQEIR